MLRGEWRGKDFDIDDHHTPNDIQFFQWVLDVMLNELMCLKDPS